MNNFFFICLTIVLSSQSFLACQHSPKRQKQTEKPNIIIILADDLGWPYVGFHNAKIKTPNIDKLATQGVIFDRFYTQANCTPTRTGLLTGLYPIRLDLQFLIIRENSKRGLPNSVDNLAKLTKRAGYKNRAIIGKWHLGHNNLKHHPLNLGFTKFYGHLKSQVDHCSLEYKGKRDWYRDFQLAKDDTGYSTTLLGKESKKFIHNSLEKNEAFFLYLAFNAPHRPWQNPDCSTKGSEKERYLNMIQAIDQQIGEITKTLKKHNQLDNTLIWFMGDNGADRKFMNKPWRGRKTQLWEGGILSPSFLHWPKQFQTKQRIPNRVGYIDVLPSISAALEIDPKNNTDGVNIFPILEKAKEKASANAKNQEVETIKSQDKNNESQKKQTEYLINNRDWYSGSSNNCYERLAVHAKNWKLVRFGPSLHRNYSGNCQNKEYYYLFNLKKDPYEQNNLIQQQTKIANRLKQKIRHYRDLAPFDESFSE